MTAIPDPTGFAKIAKSAHQSPAFIRPSVRDHYWGYEILKSEQIVDLGVLARGAAILAMLAAFAACALVWLVPAMAFAGSAMVAKALASVMFVCFGFAMMRFAARGTLVRVQVDTSTGELREVVDGMFSSVIELSRYGFDAVEAVRVVPSKAEPTFGQIQVTLKQGKTIPVGDGAIMALHPLRERLASDCGLELEKASRPAIWTGPLAA